MLLNFDRDRTVSDIEGKMTSRPVKAGPHAVKSENNASGVEWYLLDGTKFGLPRKTVEVLTADKASGVAFIPDTSDKN
jgi:hypothetical protein